MGRLAIAAVLAVHVGVAAGVFVGIRIAAGRLYAATADLNRTKERLRWLRLSGYVLGGLATAVLAGIVGTDAVLADAVRDVWPQLAPEWVSLVAWTGVLSGPVLVSELSVRLGTLPYHRRVAGLDMAYRDITAWFATRFAAGTFALAGATAVVTAAESTPARILVAVGLVALGLVLAPYALSFVVRGRPATDGERARARIPDDLGLRIVDDRTRFGVAFAAGLVPGARYVYVAESLIGDLDDRELAAVVAHEVGHHRLGHVPLRAGVFLTAAVPPVVALSLGTTVAFVVGTGLSVVGLLVGVAVVRRTEYAADEFADRRGFGTALASALDRLAHDGAVLATPGPHAGPLAAHPALHARIARLTERSRPMPSATPVD